MKISVITVSYNARYFIERTVLSVIYQDYDDYEYIIIDGNSQDGTLDILDKYKNRFSVFISEPDSGIYNAMNKAINVANGDYCIFMNAGDSFVGPHVLKEACKYLDGIDIAIGREISERGGKVIDYVLPPSIHQLKKRILSQSLSHQAAFIKRSLLYSIHYDESLKMVSDWKFWVETLVLRNYTYKPLPMDVCFFNHEGCTFKQKIMGREEKNSVIESLKLDYRQRPLTIWGRIKRKITILIQMILIKIKLLLIYLKHEYYVTHYNMNGNYLVKILHTSSIQTFLFVKSNTNIGEEFKYLFKKYILKDNKSSREIVKKQLYELFCSTKYSSIFQTEYESGNKSGNIILWVCWLQGFDDAPEIVKKCTKRIIENNPGVEIKQISLDNINDYIVIPDRIWERYLTGNLQKAHFTDYIRCHLLYKYGGIWMDPTYYLTQNIPTSFWEKSFITLKEPSTDKYLSENMWCTSFIGGYAGNTLFKILKEVFEQYLTSEKFYADYFLFDYIIKYAYDHLKPVKKEINDVPVTNIHKHGLQNCLHLPLEKTPYAEYKKDTFAFKLSWKLDKKNFAPNSLYYYLFLN